MVGAFAIFNGAEIAAWIALMIYAFEQGGATESGVVALTQLVPAGLLAPLAANLAERYDPERVLAGGYWLQSSGLAGAALTLALDGPAPLVYGCVGVTTVAISSTRPAQALVTPRLVRRVNELTALNVVAEWATQGAAFVAPAITGVLLAISGPGLVFGVFAAALVAAALAVPSVTCPVSRPPVGPKRAPIVRTAATEIGTAVRVAFGQPAVRLVLLISTAGFVVVGALDVLTIALVVDGLDGAASTAAWLTAALGAGGIVGSVAGSALVGRRLAPALVLAAVEFGVALALIGLVPGVIVAFTMVFAAGAGQAVAAIATNSLLQRCAPSESVGEAFAVRESLFCLGLGTGAIAAPALIAAFGVDATFVVVGALVPLVVMFRLVAVWRLDHAATVPIVELSLLRSLVLFRGLPAPALEGLARNAVPTPFAAGTDLMVEGEYGDRYLAIVDGTVDVVQRGEIIAGDPAATAWARRHSSATCRGPPRCAPGSGADARDRQGRLPHRGHRSSGHPCGRRDLAARRIVDDSDPGS